MIDKYSFGRITIDGEEFDKDVIVYGGAVRSWRRDKGHKVKRADIEDLAEQRPAIVVFGTGKLGRMKVSDKAEAYLSGLGIECVADRTDRAAERYNELLKQGKDAALAAHLTC